MKKVNLYAFYVTGPDSSKLNKVFEKMHSDKAKPLATRIKLISGKEFRFEHIEEISVPQSNIKWWYASFSFLTLTNGLGRGSKDTAMSSINLNASIGEKFCYDTAVLYDPMNNVFIVQYSQVGPRISQILQYLIAYSSPTIAIDFSPILKSNIAQKLKDPKIEISKVNLKINRKNFINYDSSFEKALNEYSSNEDIFQLTISSSKRGGSVGKNAKKMLGSIRKIFNKNGDGVERLQVSIINDDDTIEMLDLIKARLVSQEDVSVSPAGLFDDSSRKKACINAYQCWVRNNEIII